jgi:hypothetical protein
MEKNKPPVSEDPAEPGSGFSAAPAPVTSGSATAGFNVNPLTQKETGQAAAGSAFSEAEKTTLNDPSAPNKSHKKLYFTIIILIIFGLAAAWVFQPKKLKTVTYENGKGDTYSLKFYSDYNLKSLSDTANITPEAPVAPGLKELVSNTTVGGKTPLTLWIESNKSGAFSKDCTKLNLPQSFDAHIDFINADAPVCAIKSQGKEVMYLVTFYNSKAGYLLVIAQNVDFKALTSSPEAARQGLEKVGLEDYRDDIQIILASVRPLN